MNPEGVSAEIEWAAVRASRSAGQSLAVGLCEIFEDGKAIPDDANIRLERGHLARCGVAQDLSLAVGAAELDMLFLELDPAMSECEPRSQAPR